MRSRPRQRKRTLHGPLGDAGYHLVADQLAAAVDEDRWAVDKALALLLAAGGGEPFDAAFVLRHSAEDHGAAVASPDKASAEWSKVR